MKSESISQTNSSGQDWPGYLQLMRPANVVTAIADSLAGASVAIAVARPGSLGGVILLATASAFLYAGGVVLNDVFDSRVDAVERPERPIPSGRASWLSAAMLGILLMLVGVGFASLASPTSGWLAGMIVAAALFYNASFKRHPVGGPLFMGLCRGLNFLLGMSLSARALAGWWPLMVVPILYVGAITMVSQAEAHGNTRHATWSANALLLAVTGSLLLLGLEREYQLIMALPFIAYFAWCVWPPFVRTAVMPNSEQVQDAVKAGALSLICLNAAIASGFGGVVYGLVVLLLLPLSAMLSRSQTMN